MKINWRWLIGITLILIVLVVLPLVWQLIFPATNAYGYVMPMMRGYGYGYGIHMPMAGFGFMPFGMFFMWLIPLGTLILIVLAIVWLIKQLIAKPS